MDVAGWLRGLGLGKYEAAFLDNGIGEAVLPHLTVEDLKEVGVATVGDRRLLLAAIAALASPTPSEPIGRQPSPALPTKAPEVSAERRPITVVFCDLVGSTSLAAKLDAEDWRNLVNAYLDEASAAVTGLGGHVLKKLGDGLMALFGYPQAQENDAERAARAALAIQRALAELNARNAGKRMPELVARIGIESGPVVVDATGEVFGDAPNIAARVQAAAEPGSVLVTRNVQRQIAGLFVAEEKGTHELKGLPEPVSLYHVVRASGAGRRKGARALTPFVGREEDLARLVRRWERARSGDGQLVLIVGEPGIGKSRLLEEFHAKLGETPHTWVEWSASQLLQNTPLHPIAEWGRQRFGDTDVPAEQRLADLEGTLRQVKLDPGEYAPLLAPLLDIPLPPERAASLAPEEMRRRQLAAILAWITASARTQPMVLAFEDLQWADPTSIDVLRALSEQGAQAPIFIVATTRPEFRPPWSMRSHHSVLSLAPLDPAEVLRMIGELASRHALSKDVVKGVSERTAGVPLFVEEVTRLLLESGEQGGPQTIPPTLQQSLAARLDRLGEAREIAQIGAVLGRSFSYGLLRDVIAGAAVTPVAAVAARGPSALNERGHSGTADPSLQSALQRLVDADILFVEGLPPQANYRFKHALIQDAAYESLLKSRRQALHRRAGEILRDKTEAAAAEPEAIARHFTEAGLDDFAIEWWGKAGDQALHRSAFQEAIAHLGKAIEMADRADEARAGSIDGYGARRQRLARMRVSYGNALIAARGYGARETTEAFATVRESVEGDNAVPERLVADYGLWVASYVRGELPLMRAHATAFLRNVETKPDSAEAGVAHRVLGNTHWFAGEYLAARDHLERSLALFHPGRDDDLAFRFGQDSGVAAMLYLAIALWVLGDVRRAVSVIDGAEARFAALAHVPTRTYGKIHTALFGLMRGNLTQVASNAFEIARLVRDYDLKYWLPWALFFEGLAKAEGGAPADGLEEMRRGAERIRQNGFVWVPLSNLALGQAEALVGDLERAIATLNQAIASSEQSGHRAFDAELHRVRGDILLKRDPANSTPAEEAYQRAIAIAKDQGARSYELLASLSLAKLYQSTGRPAEGHAAIAPALEGFSPTPEMPEIAEAQALLERLA